jgi:glycosyltransferase involved in cell wall biosynthesis
MRVGFDARWYNGSGVGTYVAELLAAFAELSNEFELVVYEDPKNPVPLVSRQAISRVPVMSSRFSLAAQFELRRLCKAAQIDLFHSPYQYGAPLLLPCPLVITIHDLIPFLFRTRSWPKQLAALPFVKMGYYVAAFRANHIIADSVTTARDAKKILKVSSTGITAVHLAASGISFHPSSGPGEEDLLSKYGVHRPYVVTSSAGCNWRTKNLETALRALALGHENSDVEFQTVVYGPGRGLEVLVKRGATFGLDIRHAGYLPVNDLGALFRNAHLYISTSLYEGFGLPILEAMSCGCPVVTSSGGSLAEVAGDGAQVFDPMDAQGMSQAISSLLTCEEERKRWRARALARASKFSWRKSAEQTLAVYRQVLRSHRKSESEVCLQP